MKPLLMVCDPPCGVEYDPEWRKPDDVACVWHGTIHAALVAESFHAAALHLSVNPAQPSAETRCFAGIAKGFFR